MKIWDWFKTRKQKNELPNENQSQQSHQAQSIYIDKILQSLVESRAMLTIHFQDTLDTYASMILDIDKNKQYIILDEIAPAEGHYKAIQGVPFTVSSREHGIFISFKTSLKRHVDDQNLSFYYLTYPTDINYKQRRKAYRVPAWQENNIRADIYLPDQPRIAARIADISVSGARLLIRHNITNAIDGLKYIDQCLIISPFMKPTSFSLEIKNSYYDLAHKSTVLCCQFLDVSADKQLYLIELVGKLQQNKIQQKFGTKK